MSHSAFAHSPRQEVDSAIQGGVEEDSAVVSG